MSFESLDIQNKADRFIGAIFQGQVKSRSEFESCRRKSESTKNFDPKRRFDSSNNFGKTREADNSFE